MRFLPHPLRGAAARKVASLGSLVLVAGTVVVLAVTSDGQPVVDVSLNDGSVWVTNGPGGMAGRLNAAVGLLDLSVPVGAPDVDVLQSEYDLLLSYPGGEEPSLQVVDVARAAAGSSVTLPQGAQVAFGAGTVAILDPATGSVWVRSMETLAGFTFKDVPAEATVGTRGRVAVSPEGVVAAADVDTGKVWSISMGDDGVAEVAPEPVRLGDDIPASSLDLELTVVGSTPVLLDRNAGRVVWPGHAAVELDPAVAATAHLQQPSAAGAAAYVATTTGLLAVDLASGDHPDVRDEPVSGSPAPPVVVEGCVHAAWADPAAESYERRCGEGRPLMSQIDGLTPQAQLKFRVNRNVVVLNDLLTGDSWLVKNSGLERVDNWDDVNPTQGAQDQKDEAIQDKPDRSLPNVPPKAVDDDDPALGARAGQATILPVTANDTDGNGDVLTVVNYGPLQGGEGMQGASLSKVGKGTQLQLNLPPTASGQTSFEYSIDDGRKSPQPTARVVVKISGEDDNSAPAPLRPTEMTVGSGKTSSAYVLPDWKDDDGDELLLKNASTDDGGTVEFDANGTVTFTDSGEGVGSKSIDVVVSDGREDTEGTIAVTVSSSKKLLPDLVPDLAEGLIGTDVEVAPLVNDHSPDGSPLTLSRVSPVTGLTIRSDPVTGTFVVHAAQPGQYYLDYKAFNGSGAATSYVRLDVHPAAASNQPPVAVKDQGVLPAGGSVTVDLLQNDYDPDNDVMVVQSLEFIGDSGVKAVLLDKHQVRIEATKALAAPVTAHYTVSDGQATVDGTLIVTPGDATVLNRPPAAEPDQVTVRAGAIASIPVLDNDKDPDGGRLELDGALVDNPSDLLLFVSGSRLRVRAPAEPKTYTAVYQIRDAGDLRDSAPVTLTVLPDTPENNRAPQPQPIVERAFAGQPLRVRLDTAGLDPDGDAVSITDVVTPPSLGRIVSFGLDYLDYEPRVDAKGTDAFKIAVQDKYGGRAVADVRIGVAARAEVDQAPVALDDEVTVRPGRTIQVNVLANDHDPDGTTPALDEELRAADGVNASVQGRFVSVEVPDTTTSVSEKVGYTISDGLGGVSSAVLTVTGDVDAPLWTPQTQDDTADVVEILGKAPGDTIDVDVLSNDGDLDGPVSDLELAPVDADTSSVSADGDRLVVRLRKTSQVVAYQVTDADENRSYGFVFVAGTDEIPPMLNPSKVPLKVDQDTTKQLALNDVVLVRSGRAPILTRQSKVKAGHADGSPLVAGGGLVYTPLPGYYGPDSLSLEVTDGVDLNDPSGLLSQLTLPIDVVPSENLPPTMRSTRTQVEPGEQTTVRLGGVSDDGKAVGLADDLNPGDLEGLSFTVKGGESKVDHSVDGATLVLTTTAEAKPGDVVTLQVVATDATGAAAPPAEVEVRVVSSTRPLVALDEDVQVTAAVGQPVGVDVTGIAVNPFPDQELVVSSAEREAGVTGSTDVDGTYVSITPSQAGVLTVTFTVNDYLEDPARAVLGRIRVQAVDEDSVSGVGGGSGGTGDPTDPDAEPVAAKPDAPSKPRASVTASQTVTLSWDEPANNGAEIDGYDVKGSGGISQGCPATTCIIGGLKDGQGYTFTVRAHNAEGYSGASPASDQVTTTSVPGVMGAPQVATDPSGGKMDGKLTLSWSPPADDGGSPITGYEIRNLSTQSTETVGKNTSTVWTRDLKNGESYTFTIRAINSEGPAQQESPPSKPGIPCGPPVFTGAPVATSPKDGAAGGQVVVVSWPAADDNGDPVTGYDVQMTPGNTVHVGAEVRERAFTGVTNGQNYTFRVTATNRAGSTAGPTSNKVNPYGRATAPRNVRTADEGDHTATVAWDAPADFNGRPQGARYQISVDGNPVAKASSSPHQIGGLSNSPHTVTVQTLTYDGATEVAGFSDQTQVRPFGPPGAPAVSSTPSQRAVGFTINPPAANGRPIVGLEYRSSKGGGWVSLGPGGGSFSVGANRGESVTVEARAISEGQSPGQRLTGPSQSKADTPSPATVTASTGGLAPGGGHWVYVDALGLADGQATATFAVSSTCSANCTPPPSSTANTVGGEFHLRDGPGGRSYAGRGSIVVTITQPGYPSIQSNYTGGFFTGRVSAVLPPLAEIWSRW